MCSDLLIDFKDSKLCSENVLKRAKYTMTEFNVQEVKYLE